jgi:hypothetical protein
MVLRARKPPPSSRSELSRWLQRGALALATLASVGTLVGLWLQVRSHKPELQVQILSADSLSPSIDVPDVQYHATYKSAPIQNPWKLRLAFVNTGPDTIVGQGTKSTILGDKITVAFPEGTRVLGFPQESSTLPLVVSLKDPAQLEVTFTQWRSHEQAIYSVYVSGPDPKKYPVPSVPSRDLIDGDISVVDLTKVTVHGPLPILDRTSHPVALVGRILSILLSAAIAVLCLIFASAAVKQRIQIARWKAANGEAFAEYIDSQNATAEEKKRYKSEPWSYYRPLPDNIPKISVSYPIADSGLGASGFSLVALVIVAAATAQILATIVY